MTALRDYNAAVDFVDRNVAEGRGEKTAFIDPSRNLTYGTLDLSLQNRNAKVNENVDNFINLSSDLRT